MMKCCLLLFMLACTSLHGQDTLEKKQVFFINGYLKDLQSFVYVREPAQTSNVNDFQNRLNTKLVLPHGFTVRAEVRNRLFLGEQIKQTPGFGKSLDIDDGLVDMSYVATDDKTYVFNSNIDRLHVNWSNEKWDITAGRQRINWGVTTVWNPNALFNALNYLNFDYEERPGSDAVRVQHYMKNMSALEVAVKPGKNKGETVGALLYKVNRKGYDVQLLSGIFNKDLTEGIGWAGNIKEAGFKGELSYFFPQQQYKDSSTTSVSFSTQLDYSFKSGIYIAGSYLLNTNGSDNTINQNLEAGSFDAKNLFPFRHTFFLQGMKQFSPLFTVNASFILAPFNSQYIFFPTVSYEAGPNLVLSFIAQSYFTSNQGSLEETSHALFLQGKFNF